MTIHTIIFLPDRRLRAPSSPVTVFDDALRTLVNDMIETMYHANGAGLAANQVGITQQIAVINSMPERNEPFAIINPEMLEKEGFELMAEGCLSVPGSYDKVPRALKIKVRAQDVTGKYFEIETDGCLAHVLQHEIDHLQGKLYVDYLSPLKRQRAQQKINKYVRGKSHNAPAERVA